MKLLLIECFFLNRIFFFNASESSRIYTLSLHDALPISCAFMPPTMRKRNALGRNDGLHRRSPVAWLGQPVGADRKSTRLNSSHVEISYAVFCLKKKI